MLQPVITRLQQTVGETPLRITKFSPEEMAARPGPGKWSKKEILGHLCDSALHNLQRFCYAQMAEGVYVFPPYPQDDLVRLNNYQALPTGQTVSLWASLNRQILAVIKNLPEAKYAQPLRLPDGEEATLQWLIEDYLAHLEHHLRQIFPSEKGSLPDVPVNWQISVEGAMAALAAHPEGKPFLTLLERGSMYVEIYAPKDVDLQKPHDQDEIYVVISGAGTFFHNGERRPFRPGDLLFVPAGAEHRFEEFSADFKTWVVFY